MSLKRAGSLHGRGTRNCLKCDRELTDLKDDVINTCNYCGQQHLVDIVGKSLTLTVAEKPELRHRAIKVAAVQQAEETKEQAQELLKDVKREIDLYEKIDELKKQLKEVTKQHKQIVKETELTQEAAIARINAKDAEIELLRSELRNARHNLTITTEKLVAAERDAKEWQKAADGLAEMLEQLKAQGKW